MLQQIFVENFSISTQVLEHKVPSEILFCIFLKQGQVIRSVGPSEVPEEAYPQGQYIIFHVCEQIECRQS